jgi:RNA polymerase sigma-70 factor (ECF subfamily)
MFNVSMRITNDYADAEDILQEVWMIAAQQANERTPGAPLGAWLHTVALNLARSHFRTARRRRWLSALWGTSPATTNAGQNSPSISSELQRAALWRAVAELPRLQRDAVLLRVVDGLSTREVAAQLGRAEGTVKASLHRGLRTLRRSVRGDDIAGAQEPNDE